MCIAAVRDARRALTWQVHTRNDGRDPWNSLLKRRPLLKGLPRQVRASCPAPATEIIIMMIMLNDSFPKCVLRWLASFVLTCLVDGAVGGSWNMVVVWSLCDAGRAPLTGGRCGQVIETEEDRKKNPQARWHWSELSIGTVISVRARGLSRASLVPSTASFKFCCERKHDPMSTTVKIDSRTELRARPCSLGWRLLHWTSEGTFAGQGRALTLRVACCRCTTETF